MKAPFFSRAMAVFLLTLAPAVVAPFELAAAPVPKGAGKGTGLYFPTQVGAKWVYESPDREYTEVVTAAERKENGAGWDVAVGTLDQKRGVVSRVVWEVSDEGLSAVQKAPGDTRVAWCYLKLPHRAGAKWDFRPDSKTIRCVALEPKKVKVPAGEFDAIGVELYTDDSLYETRWYAPGIGLVMNSYGEKSKPHSVLKSFTPGKD